MTPDEIKENMVALQELIKSRGYELLMEQIDRELNATNYKMINTTDPNMLMKLSGTISVYQVIKTFAKNSLDNYAQMLDNIQEDVVSRKR